MRIPVLALALVACVHAGFWALGRQLTPAPGFNGMTDRPITVDELPKAIADVVRRVELKTVKFATAIEISKEDILMSESRA